MNRWFHRAVLGHAIAVKRVTVPMYDPSKGELHKCSCGRIWAL